MCIVSNNGTWKGTMGAQAKPLVIWESWVDILSDIKMTVFTRGHLYGHLLDRQISFLRWRDSGFANHTQEQGPCLGIVGQGQADSMGLCFCLFVFSAHFALFG